MQTIKTETGTYKLKDDRDMADFMKKLKKPPARRRVPKDSIRHFPAYVPGKTSVQEYVKRYFELNNWTGVHNLFPDLPSAPASVYDPSTPLCEVFYE